MIKKTIILLSIPLLLIQCNTKSNPFLITKESVGELTKKTDVKNIQTAFIKDSIVKDSTEIALVSSTKKIKIYEKGGKHLLSLTPNNDSISTIKNIRVYDARYTTDKGINLNSTFKDIKDNYSIKKVVNSLNNVVIFLKDNYIYFTIDKKELPANIRYTNTTIEAVQIPDAAKIKYFMIGWD